MPLNRNSRLLSAALGLLALSAWAGADTDSKSNSSVDDDAPGVPAWLYPTNSVASTPRRPDAGRPLHLPGSRSAYTREQLADLFSAPDWHPESHGQMPEIVARGRPPKVRACGYCHSPSGQGRPENAALAGLPAAYIEQQMQDFASGVRRAAWKKPYGPADLMIQGAMHVRADEVRAAADYFSRQTQLPRVRVVEAKRVPRWQVIGQVYAAIPGAGDEPIDDRLMEYAPDPEDHEMRNDRMRYIAYVPVGSITRGRFVADKGVAGPATACVTCHGQGLKGVGLVPPLAGRSPTYLLRALFAFRTGARAGSAAEPMRAPASSLGMDALVDVVAYAASLRP